MYAWLLFGHLASVVVLITGLAISAASVDSFRRAWLPRQAQTLADLAVLGDRTAAAGFFPLIGFGAALAGKFYSFSDRWVMTALALTVLLGVLGGGVVGSRARRIRTTLADAPTGSISGELAALLGARSLHIANRVAIVLLFEIVFLMALKPAIGGILLSLLVTTVVAAALSSPLLVKPRPAPVAAPHRPE